MITAAVLGAILFSASPPDPLFLQKPRKIKNIKLIVGYAVEHQQDPYELIAIALTESNLNPKAVSHKGAVGLFQVMCKYWYKPLGYKDVDVCNKRLYEPINNVRAGVKVLTTVRKKYTQCEGELAYRCYFAGQGWTRFGPKTQAAIVRYENKVKEKHRMLLFHYKKFIDRLIAQSRKQM
jgi:hypothetical protein